MMPSSPARAPILTIGHYLRHFPVPPEMLSSSGLAKFHRAREALFEVALETDHQTLTKAYTEFYWHVLTRTPNGVSATIENYQRLPHKLFTCLRLETTVGTRTFFRGRFEHHVSDLMQRIGLPPLLTAINARFVDRGYTVRILGETNDLVIEPNTSDHVPDDIVCPITHTIMLEPIVASDGHTYEKEAILKIIQSTKVSPLTRETLTMVVVPNHALRKRIASYAMRGDAKRTRVA